MRVGPETPRTPAVNRAVDGSLERIKTLVHNVKNQVLYLSNNETPPCFLSLLQQGRGFA